MTASTRIVRLRQVKSTGRGRTPRTPSKAQMAYLKRGVDQAGGKLPLFDLQGQKYPERTIRSCIDNGWAEPWFHNPLKPDWLVCKLTDSGRSVVAED